MMQHRWLLSEVDTIQMFRDKYGTRYVEPLENRVVAFVFFNATCSCSETICYWYKDFISIVDAIIAARNWCLWRCPLEKSPTGDDIDPPIRYAPGIYHVEPDVEQPAW